MTPLGQRLHTEHQALDVHFEDIANRVHVGDTALLDAGWEHLEAALLAHMDFEERHLLPRFARDDAAEAAQIRAEHDEIRRRLTELGVAIQLHTLREEAALEFLAALRGHAAREDSLFYAWADRSRAWAAPEAPPPPARGAALPTACRSGQEEEMAR